MGGEKTTCENRTSLKGGTVWGTKMGETGDKGNMFKDIHMAVL